MALKDVPGLHRNNVYALRRSPLSEVSGALGDLGTLLPLMMALALQGSVSLSSTLVFSGFFNVATGVLFGIPLPVQPMKAIAAAAIASRAPMGETVAAGGLVGAAVLLLSATGLIRWLARRVPVPVVKGIQLGAGLSLVISAGTTLLTPLGWAREPSPLDNRLWALAAFLALLLTQRVPRFPYALATFLAGLALAVVAVVVSLPSGGDGHERRQGGLLYHQARARSGGGGGLPHFEVWRPSLLVPAFPAPDAWAMAVAQLPLTVLNSVVAASALAAELFPALPVPGVTALGVSVGAMNLAGCWFGAMPVCHGAGGLAAQYRFGARSGASVVLLGLFKMVLGLFFGETLLGLLERFPRSILGVMVVAAGLELSMVGQSLNHGAADLWEAAVEEEAAAAAYHDLREEGDEEDARAAGPSSSSSSQPQPHPRHTHNAAATAAAAAAALVKRHREVSDDERRERWAVMLTTAAGILAFRNDAVGFAAGMLCYGAYRLADWLERRRELFARRDTLPLLHN